MCEWCVFEKAADIASVRVRERAADTGHSNQHNAQGCTSFWCGAGAGCSAIKPPFLLAGFILQAGMTVSGDALGGVLSLQVPPPPV